MRLFRKATLVLAATALAAAVGCTSSPSEPKGGGTPVTPKPPVTQTTYNVTVTANPPNITSGATGSSTITVDVRRTDTGAPPADGTTVTLTTTLGTFNQVGGPRTVDLQLVNGRAQAALFGGTEVGTATVRANVAGSTGAANVSIGAPAAFFVSSIQPNVGDPAGGQTVTIIGGGFVSPVRVTFNQAAATVRSVSPNQIVVVTPSAAAAGIDNVPVGSTAPVTVTVTNRVNQADEATDALDNGFTYSYGGGTGGQPQIFAVSPSSGTNDGGTRVTITGTGFAAPLQVFFGTGLTAATFNGVEATVVSVTPTQIVAITPAARGFGLDLSNKQVNVLVKNVNGGFAGVGQQQFKYGAKLVITAIQGPGTGPAEGGTQLVILGQGFDEPTTVSFHFKTANVNVPQLVLQTTGTQVVIRTTPAPVPSTCPEGGLITVDKITVTNVDNGDTATADVGFNYQLPLPQITSISPGSGDSNTTVVTITGQSFPANPSVIFGNATNGSSATILQSSSTSIRVTVPNAPQGFSFNTQDCGDGGTKMVATPINITVQDFASKCLSTFNNGFLLSPPDPLCHGETPQTPPTASFTSAPVSGHTMQFNDTSSGTPTLWSWDFGDGSNGPERSQQNPTHTYALAGNYSVKLMVSNGAGTSQTAKVVTVP
jgi:PKD repeat protein